MDRSADDQVEAELPESVAERLSALEAAINAWDWRTEDVGPIRPKSSESHTVAAVQPPVPTPPTPSPYISQNEAAPKPPSVEQNEFVPAPAAPAAPSERSRPAVLSTGHPIWLWIGGAAVIVAIIGTLILRTAGSSPHASGKTNTSTTVARSTPPIDSVAKTKFAILSNELDTANKTLNEGLAAAGASPTLTQVGALLTPYTRTLQTYEFEVHAVPWPATDASDIQVFYAQYLAYGTLVNSFSTVNAATLPSFLSQLKIRGGTTESADNTVRQDLGLPAAHFFP